ncbi:MAG: exosortase-associated EpsI family protein [Defluviimonas denitrificans]
MPLTAATSLAWQTLPAPQIAAPDRRTPLALYPRVIDNWQSHTEQLDPDIEKVRWPPTITWNAIYQNPDVAQPVSFFVAWYNKQTEGQGHPLARGLPADSAVRCSAFRNAA